MKFIIRLGKDHKSKDEFFYPDPGPIPPIVDPEDAEEPKDGAPAEEEKKGINLMGRIRWNRLSRKI